MMCLPLYPTFRSGLLALTPRGANGSYIAAAIKDISLSCHQTRLKAIGLSYTATAYPTFRSGLLALTPRGANGSYIAAAIKDISLSCHQTRLKAIGLMVLTSVPRLANSIYMQGAQY